MESHHESTVENEIVIIPTDGSATPKTIIKGSDFFSSPRINDEGNKIAWISWQHPNMPFDSTELYIADFTKCGDLSNQKKIAGGDNESVMQPKWHKNLLFFISDASGWWKLNKYENGHSKIIIDDNSDIAEAPWVFGISNYAISNNNIITSISKETSIEIIKLDLRHYTEKRKLVPFSGIKYLTSDENMTCFISGTTTSLETVTKTSSYFDNFEVLKELNMQIDVIPEWKEIAAGHQHRDFITLKPTTLKLPISAA